MVENNGVSAQAAEDLGSLLYRMQRGERVHGVIKTVRGRFQVMPIVAALTEVEQSLKQMFPNGVPTTPSHALEPMSPDQYQDAVDKLEPLVEILNQSSEILGIYSEGKVIVEGVSVTIGKPWKKNGQQIPHQDKINGFKTFAKNTAEYLQKRSAIWEKQTDTSYTDIRGKLITGIESALSAQITSADLLEGYEALHIGLEGFENGWMEVAPRVFGHDPDISDVLNAINTKETEARISMTLAQTIVKSSKEIINASQGEFSTLSQEQLNQDVIRGEDDSYYGVGLQGTLDRINVIVGRFTDVLSSENTLVLKGITPSTEKYAALLKAINTIADIESSENVQIAYAGRIEQIRADLSSGTFVIHFPEVNVAPDISLDALKPYPAAFNHYSGKQVNVFDAADLLRTNFDIAITRLNREANGYLDSPPSSLADLNSTVPAVNSLLRKVEAADGFIEAGLTDKSAEDIFPKATSDAINVLVQSLENLKGNLAPLELYLKNRNLQATRLTGVKTALENGSFENQEIDLHDSGYAGILAKIFSNKGLHQGYNERISEVNLGIEADTEQLQRAYRRGNSKLREQANVYLNTVVDSFASLDILRAQITSLQIKAMTASSYQIPGAVEPENSIGKDASAKLTEYKQLLDEVKTQVFDPANTEYGRRRLDTLSQYVGKAEETLDGQGRSSRQFSDVMNWVVDAQERISHYRGRETSYRSRDPRVASFIHSQTNRTLADSISPEMTERIQKLKQSKYM